MAAELTPVQTRAQDATFVAQRSLDGLRDRLPLRWPCGIRIRAGLVEYALLFHRAGPPHPTRLLPPRSTTALTTSILRQAQDRLWAGKTRISDIR
jgi:hypothetical protein